MDSHHGYSDKSKTLAPLENYFNLYSYSDPELEPEISDSIKSGNGIAKPPNPNHGSVYGVEKHGSKVDKVVKWLNLDQEPKPEISDPLKSSSGITLPNPGYGVEEHVLNMDDDDAYYPVFRNEKVALQNEEFDRAEGNGFYENAH